MIGNPAEKINRGSAVIAPHPASAASGLETRSSAATAGFDTGSSTAAAARLSKAAAANTAAEVRLETATGQEPKAVPYSSDSYRDPVAESTDEEELPEPSAIENVQESLKNDAERRAELSQPPDTAPAATRLETAAVVKRSTKNKRKREDGSEFDLVGAGKTPKKATTPTYELEISNVITNKEYDLGQIEPMNLEWNIAFSEKHKKHYWYKTTDETKYIWTDEGIEKLPIISCLIPPTIEIWSTIQITIKFPSNTLVQCFFHAPQGKVDRDAHRPISFKLTLAAINSGKIQRFLS